MLHYPFNVHNSPNLLVHLQQHHFWKTIQIRNSSSKCQVCEDFLWEEQPGYFCASKSQNKFLFLIKMKRSFHFFFFKIQTSM